MWSWNNGSSTKYQYFKDTSSKGHTGRASFGYNYISAQVPHLTVISMIKVNICLI